ncbi:hypothetical protein C8Q74DRAFT_1374150 [Fomes fomentarius]|nr:hypothetical protein C8Q74DRAFT_1374150 [Fomes fomentarius]
MYTSDSAPSPSRNGHPPFALRPPPSALRPPPSAHTGRHPNHLSPSPESVGQCTDTDGTSTSVLNAADSPAALNISSSARSVLKLGPVSNNWTVLWPECTPVTPPVDAPSPSRNGHPPFALRPPPSALRPPPSAHTGRHPNHLSPSPESVGQCTDTDGTSTSVLNAADSPIALSILHPLRPVVRRSALDQCPSNSPPSSLRPVVRPSRDRERAISA